MNSLSKSILAGSLALFTGFAQAATISTSAGCGSVADPDSASCDPLVDDDYGYSFVIDDNGNATGDVYSATLTNTSPTSSDALIDALFFNVNPNLVLGTDFTIENISPAWTFTQNSGL